MNLSKFKYTTILAGFILFPSVLLAKTNTVSDYFNARALSSNNIHLALGIPLFIPPSSLKNSFAQYLMVQMDYRKELKTTYPLPIIFRTEWTVGQNRLLQSATFFSGLRFPKTHRKTPFYFGLALGAGWNRKKGGIQFYWQFLSSFRVLQITRSASALLHFNASYPLGSVHWWRTPTVHLLAGMDMNW